LSDYTIIRAGTEHREQICALQTELWSPDIDFNDRYLRWRYEENCFPEDSHIYLAMHQGKVVGMRGFHGARWITGDDPQVHRCLMAGDAMICAEHRDRSLVTAILQQATADLAKRGYEYLFSFGASRINVLGLLINGWKTAGAMEPIGRETDSRGLMPRLRRQSRRTPILWRYAHSKALHTRDERHPFRHLDRHLDHDAAGMTVTRQLRAQDMAAIATLCQDPGRIRHQRDSDYLQWRYTNPLREYRFLFAHDNEGNRGYLSLGRQTSKLSIFSRVQLLDLEASSSALRNQLLRTAAEWGRFQEFVAWGTTLHPKDSELLAELGFGEIHEYERVRGCPCLLVKRTHDDMGPADWRLGDRPLLDPPSWDLRMLYSFRG
jgi:hypothetical protein